MHENHAYQRVYWGGAAIALLLDVALREAGSSLDAAMRHLDTCCADALPHLASRRRSWANGTAGSAAARPSAPSHRRARPAANGRPVARRWHVPRAFGGL
jgi:hypothetical protein